MGKTQIVKKKEKVRPGAWQIILIAGFLFYMFIPIISTYLFSVATRWDRTILPEGYTLEFYGKTFEASYFLSSLRNSIILSVSTIFVSLVLIVPTTYWVHVRLPQAKPILDMLMILPFGIPTVVLALALVQVYNPTPLGHSPVLLIGAVFIYSMPFMYRPISNALNAIDAQTLTEAGQSLGATTGQVLLKVIIPNIFAGIISGSLLVFATVFAEFTLTKLILGARFKTFPLLLVEYTRINGNIAAAFSVISFTIAWLVSILILWVGKKSQGASAEAVRSH
ncbi:ABC transporter permease [Pelolinea submarina]|jgi:putative spermidine/putrescine transport system permease protein|uniref:Putative spermidine/putrescine transport system permease protein n=1 Tax=Pelolinea submarina TaxID=913107 RepID=A0A347ZWU6_9CHLR|nr:ABC transporter permease subunit [Pelolinea submarina]REG05520.1 putative spermidine/putrescine transport system permease protein [Pelolinea submarina]BBB49777.1 spermidine/putrescine transport system permease protein [Pelolinea submarina]